MVKRIAETRPPPGGSRATNNNKKKSARRLLSAPNAAALKKSAKPARENPFENFWTRRKLDVIGKKRKGEGHHISLARSGAVEKRRKTLLKEYEQSRKASVFLDKRIGENNDELKEFDKAILRKQRERQLKLKKESKYNLSDGEEDDVEVHQADFLLQTDDFEDDISPDDDEDNENQKDSTAIKRLYFQSMNNSSDVLEEEEKKHKNKKQVMDEIVAKSKLHKVLKAKEKEEDEHLMEQLDKDFTSLAQSEALLSLTQPNKINALKALLNKSQIGHSAKEGLSSSADKESSKKEQPDAYDKLVKAMVLDLRARPSDRTKTPEEIAQEERDRLEMLEEERQKRMRATDDSDDEDNDSQEDFHELSPRKSKHMSGDDLGDSFLGGEELANKKGWVDDVLERKDDDDNTSLEVSESDEDNGESDDDEDSGGDEHNSDDERGGNSENVSSMKDWEQSDDDDDGTDEEETEKNLELEFTEDKNDSVNARKRETAGKVPLVKKEALPFVIEAPKDLKELCKLLDNHSYAEVVEAINRIRTCNAIRLSVENRKKMQVFYGVLLQYFAVLATRRPLNIMLINILVKPLMEMSIDIPYFAAICARERLMHIRTQFCEDVKDPEKNSWPSLKTLLLLRLWSLTFPCSDFRHVVMTPATLLMSEYLMRCPILTARDVAIGSFLCCMLLSVAKQSQKFYPEAIRFLQILMMSATELKKGSQQLSQCYYLVDLKALKPWLHICNQVSGIHPIDFFMVMDMPADSPLFESDSYRASVLLSVTETLKGFVNIYEKFSSFPEIFLPISSLLHEVIKQDSIPDSLQGNMEDVAQLIKQKADEHHTKRQPLQMRKQKPVPIKLLNPKFEEDFVKGRDYDPDRERVERKKLKKLLKREARGAARELRKDNYFLHEVKEKERLLLEEERVETYGKAMAFLQEQEHAFRSGQLGKGRKGRR